MNTKLLSKSKVLTFLLIFGFFISKAQQHFPYPVIFVHGLTSSADRWFDFYDYGLNHGWSYGGHLKFCLNTDSDNSTSNLASDFGNFVDEPNLPAADFYLINFNVDNQGTSFGDVDIGNYSNQAAIFKQGLAISNAITHVLNVTGKDKVVLVAHSMGGLACRQYIQNPTIWQSDGNHHVAKFVTFGTPHNGSNVPAVDLGQIFGFADKQSEAMRDIKNMYNTDEWGAFLWGGIEDFDLINNSSSLFPWDYYNVDVNCNGQIGNVIEGLNQKSIATNIDYTFVTGQQDLLVSAFSSNLKNIYTGLQGDELLYNQSHGELGTFPKNVFEGMDETDEFDLAYEVNVNQLYNGYITEQGTGDNYAPFDYDTYKYDIPEDGIVSILIGNNSFDDFELGVVNTSGNLSTYDLSFPSGGAVDFETATFFQTTGSYYLDVWAEAIESFWEFPYNYTINYTPCVEFSPEILVTGNTVLCTGETIVLNAGSGFDSYLWSNGSTASQITVSSAGNYSVEVDYNGCNLNSINSITVSTMPSPSASFDFTIGNGGNVLFNDLSQNGDSYLWDFGNGNTSNDINPNYTYSQSGNYTVTLTVSNNCGSISFSQTVEIIITSYEKVDNIELHIAPNPFENIIFINTNINLINYNFDVFSATGEKVKSGTLIKNEIEFSSSLPSGIYFLKIYDKNSYKHFLRKVIKQ